MIQHGNLFQAKYRDLVGMIFQSQYQYQQLQHLLDEFNSRELAEITEANIDIDRILSLAGGTVK